MDYELNTVSRDWLKEWRNQARLSSAQVDEALGLPPGTTSQHETNGLAKVPGCEMSRLVGLYGVAIEDLYVALIGESDRIRRNRLKR